MDNDLVFKKLKKYFEFKINTIFIHFFKIRNKIKEPFILIIVKFKL